MTHADRYAAWRAPAPMPPPSSRPQFEAIMGELARLGWTAEQKADYLTNRWGYTHAVQLDDAQAGAFLAYLQEQQP